MLVLRQATRGLATKAKTSIVSSPVPKKYLDYYGKDQESLAALPAHLFNQKQRIPEYYLVGKDSREEIFSRVTEKNNSWPVVEINPGLGVLTERLAAKKNMKLFLVETDPNLASHLREKYKRANVRHEDFVSRFWLSETGKREEEKLFNVLPRDKPAKLVMATGSRQFFKSLITSAVKQALPAQVLEQYEMFTVVNPNLYLQLTCNSRANLTTYGSTSILFQLLFEFEFMSKLKRKDFLPWPSAGSSSQPKLRQVPDETDNLYFVRLKPRFSQIYDEISLEHVELFAKFIKQTTSSLRRKVIPTFESWIPNIGQKIISLGPTKTSKVLHSSTQLSAEFNPCVEINSKDYFLPCYNIFTTFGDLSPNQFLSLFKFMQGLPDFQDIITKLETTPEQAPEKPQVPSPETPE